MKNMKVMLLCALIALSACKAKKEQPKPPTPAEAAQELRTDLFEAVLAKDYESVKVLIGQKVNLHSYDESGHTPLMKAVLIKDPVMVDILIRGGSKIFYPFLHDTKENAYTKAGESDKETRYLFENERSRLYNSLESLIAASSFTEAIQYIQDNYIPVNQALPSGKATVIDLAIESAKSGEEGAGTFVKFIINTALPEGFEINEYKEKLVGLSSLIKDPILFDYLVSEFRKTGTSSDLNVIIADDTTKLPWVLEKVRTLNKHKMQLNITKSSTQLITLLTSSNTTTPFLNSSKAILEEVLLNNTVYTDRSKFLLDLLKAYFAKAHTNPDFLRFASESLKVWKNTSLPQSGYNFDPHMKLVIDAIEGKSFDKGQVGTLSDSMSAFLSNNNEQSFESLKKVITGDFTPNQKTDLINILLKTIEKLPEGITAIALESNNIGVFKLLLSDPNKSDQTLQSEAIYTAVSNLDNAYSIIEAVKLLKERNVSFNNEHGAKALETAFKSFWEKGQNETVISYFLQNVPETVRAMSEGQVRDLLKNQLDYIRKTGTTGLLEFNLIVSAMNPAVESKMYEKSSFKHFQHPLMTTVIWDFIDVVVTAHADHNIDYSTWLEILPKLLEKFPKDTASFYKASDKENFDPKKYLTQNAFSLALLMYIGDDLKDQIRYSGPYTGDRKQALPVKEQDFSWDVFLKSRYFKRNNKSQAVWKEITNLLISSGNFKIEMTEHILSIELLSLIVAGALYDTFPAILNNLGDLSMKIPMNELSCMSIDSTEDRMDRPMGNMSPIFILLPIRMRTCREYEDITDSDLAFMKAYMEQILIEPDFDVYAEAEAINETSFTHPAGDDGNHVTEVACDGLYDWQNTPYSNEHSDLGVRQKRNATDLIDEILENKPQYQSLAGKTCTAHTHNIKIQTFVYRMFANSFYNCASDRGLMKIVNYFQSIEEKYQLKSEKTYSLNIGFCKW